MAKDSKKRFIVRPGFVVALEIITKGTGGTESRSIKTLTEGEEVALTYEEYMVHAHKLEHADPKDRAAALEEESERAKAKVANDPLHTLAHLVEVLSAAQVKPAAAEAAPAAK